MELKEYRLGDVADIITGVSYSPSDITTEGIRILRGGNVQNGNILCKEDDVFLPLSYADKDNQIHRYDTVIVSSTGSIEALAKAATCFNNIPNTQIGAFLRIIRPKKPEYAMLVSMWCTSQHFRDYIINQAKGTSINNIRTDFLTDYKILMPQYSDLQKISNFYLSINEKISLCREMNRELEGLARQIYQYWFLQFQYPNATPQRTYNPILKHNIPDGWHCGNLFEIANFTNGLACQNHRPAEGEKGIPVIKIKEMHDGFSNDTEFVSENIPESVKVHNGDILFSWSASLEVMMWANGEGGLNQHIFKVTPKEGYTKIYCYFQLLYYIDVFKKIADARKTTMGHITQDHLQQSTIAIPDDLSIIKDFEAKVAPMFDSIVNNQTEISALTHQRDALLPLLMNRQVVVD